MRAQPFVSGFSLFLAACLSDCAADVSAQREKPLLHGAPAYPATAMLEGRGGWANLDCTITAAGATQDCQVTGASAPEFAASALDFVRHARYVPAMHNGVAVEQKHHRIAIHYTLPPQTVRADIVCGVQASGAVHDCRLPPDLAKSALGRSIDAVLERIRAAPVVRNGQAADDPNRRMTVQLQIAPLPLARPLPPPSGDIVSRGIIACHPASVPEKRCAPEQAGSESTEPVGTARYQIVLAISGVAAPETGDFSQ